MEPKFHHLVHESPPLDPIPSQFNPVHIFTSYVIKIHCSIIFSSTIMFYFSSYFLTKTLYLFVIYSMRATCPAKVILRDLFTLTVFGEE